MGHVPKRLCREWTFKFSIRTTVRKKEKKISTEKEEKETERYHITIEKTSILCLKICKYDTIYAFNLARRKLYLSLNDKTTGS